MSLATQCTSCSTVFRVVQDQLKVSEGWVRCGRCDAVFNALEGLFDLGREAPVEWTEARPAAVAGGDGAGGGHGAEGGDGMDRGDAVTLAPSLQPVAVDTLADATEFRPADDEIGPTPADDGGTPSALDELFADPVDAHLFGPRRRAESAPKPAGQLGARDRVEFSDARFDSDLFAENTSAADTEVAPSTVSDAAPLESTLRPDFVRRAERRARWRSTPARVALGAASVVAVVMLLAQIGHHYRDTLASQWPALRPVLSSWCSAAKCAIEAPRHLDDVLVESSALTRAAGLDGFVLSVNLRNRSGIALALPSVDLNLTDGNGRLVARRALAPRDFRASEVLAAGAEAALQLTIATGAVTVAGYTVEIFYP